MSTGLSIITQENTQVVRQGLQNLSAKIPQVGRLGIYRTALRIKTRLGKPGSPVTRPIRWDTDKQRRAFFATDGFDGGIPTIRSGETNSGWELVPLSNGYQLANKTRGALFVFGDMFGKSQSLIHQGDWPLMKDVVDEEIGKLPEDVSEELRTATIAEGFAVGL